MSNDWVNQVKGTDESTDSDTDDQGATLFEDNFKRLVEDDDIESLNVQTITDQIDEISDVDLLEEALDIDGRKGSSEAYEARIDDLTEDEEDAGDEPEPESEPEPEPEPEPPEEDEAEEPDEEPDENTVEVEAVQDASESSESDSSEETPDGSDDETDATEEDVEAESTTSTAYPEVNVGAIAPDAVNRTDAVEAEDRKTVLVWGGEGTGKSHFAHSAPGPVAYIDTEGKATDLADKFDKPIHYWQPDDYQELINCLDQAMNVLAEYKKKGHLGTIVVDSITVVWDWAQQDYVNLAYPSAQDPDDVNFKSGLQGGEDWKLIKRRHNTNFRDRIIQSPYHVVFTAAEKEDYNAVIEGADGKPMMPDGEKHNPYVVRDVVRLRTSAEGKTVGDLHKASRTRYSFLNLEWPEFVDVYDAVSMLVEAEQSDEEHSVAAWPFDVIDGRPVNAAGGSDDEETDE